jgi:threonine/homoserine/homoserine lactone efflux protein
MPETATLVAFAAVCVGMVLTPGPNMLYLVSRSLSQGAAAGVVSLGGVLLGFVFFVVATAFGLTALLLAVPVAYDVLRFVGAAYLGWLAWQTLKPGGKSPFEPRELPHDPPRRLFAMGLLTSLLNPKVAMLYVSLLPQFIDATRDDVFVQSLVFGGLHIAVSFTGNLTIALTAGAIAGFLARRPLWVLAQRWLMGLVLGGLALRMALDARR